MDIQEFQEKIGKDLPQDFIDFYKNGLDKYYEGAKLGRVRPGFGYIESLPISFDLGEIYEGIYGNDERWDKEGNVPLYNLIPFGIFLEEDDLEQIHDIYDFLVVRKRSGLDSSIETISDEGEALLFQSFPELLSALIPKSSPRWHTIKEFPGSTPVADQTRFDQYGNYTEKVLLSTITNMMLIYYLKEYKSLHLEYGIMNLEDVDVPSIYKDFYTKTKNYLKEAPKELWDKRVNERFVKVVTDFERLTRRPQMSYLSVTLCPADILIYVSDYEHYFFEREACVKDFSYFSKSFYQRIVSKKYDENVLCDIFGKTPKIQKTDLQVYMHLTDNGSASPDSEAHADMGEIAFGLRRLKTLAHEFLLEIDGLIDDPLSRYERSAKIIEVFHRYQDPWEQVMDNIALYKVNRRVRTWAKKLFKNFNEGDFAQKEKDLYYAANGEKKTSLKTMKKLLDEKVSPNGNNDTFSALMFAAQSSNVKAVELLLEKGADADLCNKYFRHPIHFTEDEKIKKMLLDHGSSVESAFYTDHYFYNIDNSELLRGKSRKEFAAWGAPIIEEAREKGLDHVSHLSRYLYAYILFEDDKKSLSDALAIIEEDDFFDRIDDSKDKYEE